MRSVVSTSMLLAAGVLLGAPAIATRNVRVTLETAGEGVADLTGTITLRAVMGPQPPRSQPVASTTRTATFAVPAHTMWETSVAVKGWWAAPAVVAVQDQDLDIPVRLLPTGTLIGRLVPPPSSTPPVGLSVKVDVPPGKRQLGPPSSETPCTIADATFSCDVPAGTLDLSFHAKGYGPVYRWGVRVAQGAPTDLGLFALSQGSAVSGFLALAGKTLEVGKGKVGLFIDAPGASATASRLSRPIAEGGVATNGFFQLTDIPPGRYVLQASYPGFAAATLSPIEVLAHVETKVKRVIELQPPATLTLRVEPAADAQGKEWLFRVLRASAINNRYESAPIFSGPGHEGAVTLRDQPGGRYSVAIADASSNPFVAEEFTTAGLGDETHTFTMELIKIKGRIRRGDTPLAANLWFGGRHGDKHVALRSNEDGVFRGVLPHAGAWRVTVSGDALEADVKTDITKPDSGKEADVALTIPANHVEGVVIDAANQPLRLAAVRFTTDTDFAAMRQTDATGRFAFDGVAPGRFTLAAESGGPTMLRTSQPYTATIGDADQLAGITLKVLDGQPIHGRVLGRDAPVIGADVSVYSGGATVGPETNVTSGPDGIFDTSVPTGLDRTLVEVHAPGYALRVFDVAIDGRAVTLNLPQAGGTLVVTPPKDANGLFFFQDGRFLQLGSLIQWARSRGEGSWTAIPCA